MKKKKLNKEKIGKKKSSKRNFRILSIFFFLFILSYLFFSSSIFALKEIRFSGNKKVTSSKIVGLLRINPRENIFKISSDSVKKKLDKEPWIKEVEIRKEFPDSLSLEVKERKEKMAIYSSNYIFLVDEEGVILEKLTNYSSSSLPVVSGFNFDLTPGDKIEEEEIFKIIECINYSSYLPERLVKIKVSENKKFYLYISSGLEIRLGKGENIKEKLKIVPHLLEKAKKENLNLNYLDLQVENRPAGGVNKL